MAARRLLIILLILLGVSTLAAALAPPRALRDGTTSQTTTAPTVPTETAPTEVAPAGKYFPVEIRVGGRKVPVVACPAPAKRKEPCTPIRVGDQLSLIVTSAKVAEIEIPAFGLIGVASPSAPAIFELLFDSAATYGVKFTETGKIAAQIEVLPPKAKPTERTKPGGGPKSGAREGSGPA